MERDTLVASRPPASPSGRGGRPWSERLSTSLRDHPRRLFLVALPLVALATLGYGTDIDAGGLRATGAMLRNGAYRPSRLPGSWPTEALTAVLDPIGGSLAVNLVSVAAGVAVVVLVARLLRRAGAPHAELAALVVAANAHFLVAGSSLVDFLWALAPLLAGLDLLLRRRPVAAGVLFGLAVGVRLSTLGLVVAALVATAWREPGARPRLWRAGAATVLVGAACYVPAWAWADHGTGFLEGSFGSPSTFNLLGRTAVKTVLFVGLPAVVVLAAVARPTFAGLRARLADPLVTFALLGAAASAGVYLRFPLKLGHLLPLLVCGALLVGSAPRVRASALIALLVAQLLWGVVAVRTVVPDRRDDAGSAHLAPAVVLGPLVTDVRCRLDQPVDAAADDPAVVTQAHAAFRCADDWAYGDDG